MYKLENIYKSYDGSKTFVLNNLNLEINEGDFIAITGLSGSGKTTLMNILSTLDKPTEGHYLFHNKNLCKLSLDSLARFRNKEIGIVFQDFNLIPEFSVIDNIKLPLMFSKEKSKVDIEQIIDKLLLRDLIDKKAKYLSGGEQQRVAFARALVNDPKLILADEPTGNLDDVNSSSLLEIVKDLNKQGKTIVVITHNMSFASHFNKIYVLENGKLHKK